MARLALERGCKYKPIKKNKVMETKLTIQQQIEVLKNINWRDIEIGRTGLCLAIVFSISRLHQIFIKYDEVSDYIPLFTFENAKQFGALKWIFWWRLSEGGLAKRKEFVNWIISELEKQLNK